MGSNQRRLSRRFYSPILLFESYATDLPLCVPRRGSGPPPSAMRPWPPDSGAVRATDEGGRSTDDEGAGHGRGRKNPRTARARAVSRPSAGAVSRPSDRLSGFDLAFRDSHSLSSPPSSPVSVQDSDSDSSTPSGAAVPLSNGAARLIRDLGSSGSQTWLGI